MTVRRVTDAERRARLGRRHRLEPARADSIEELCDDLVVLHATDPATIYLSIGARRPGVTPADVDDALFERRTMYRTLAMRRTLFVATDALGPVVEGSSSPPTAASERKRLVKFVTDTAIPDPDRWLATLFDEVLEALAAAPVDERGEGGRSARQLTGEVPRLATRLIAGLGTRQEMELAATSRVLGLMAVEGLLVRGRPSGGWTGRQYAWHRRDRWWPDERRPIPEPDPEVAAVELLRRYLARFGPATLTDLAWWTGWTKTRTRAALGRLDTVEVGLDGEAGDEPGHVLAEDAEPVPEPERWAALWPSLDPTAMGWKQRSWYLGPHRDPLFDRNGNIGPTVWVDGRIVGGWSQRPDGQVVVELLEPVDGEASELIAAQRARITDFVGPTVVKPSFPTPLQKRLSAG